MREQPTRDDKTIVKDYLALCVKNYGKHPTDYQKGIILGLECALGFIKSASSPQLKALPPTTCSPSSDADFIAQAKKWCEEIGSLSDGQIVCKLADILAERYAARIEAEKWRDKWLDGASPEIYESKLPWEND